MAKKEGLTPLQEALNAFTSAVAKKEGKNSQTPIGNIRESVNVMNSIIGGDRLHGEIMRWYRNDKRKQDSKA